MAAEPITDVDATAAAALKELLDELDANDVVFAFAELKGPVWDQLKQYGLAQRIGEDHRFPTDRHRRQGGRPAHGNPLGRPGARLAPPVPRIATKPHET